MSDFFFEGQQGLLLRKCAPLEALGVGHGFTTRVSGCTAGVLSSFNLSIKKDPENTAKNHALLRRALGCRDLSFADQVHSDAVFTVTEHTPAGQVGQLDAFITDVPGRGLMVFSADCIPVLLYDPVTHTAGAAHSGWRGTALGIAGKTALAMEKQYGVFPGNLAAAIGPGIGRCCFETDSDVPDAMRSAFGEAAEPFIRPRGQKWDVELKGLVALSLRRAGVEKIYIDDMCTCCSEPLFWSHRRQGSARGLQGAIIALCAKK